MGQRLPIEWQETTDQLQLFYRWERNPHRKMRLQALWHLRGGKRLQDVVNMLGVCYHTLQYWEAWYRVGGLAEVLRRVSFDFAQAMFALPHVNNPTSARAMAV